MPYTEKQLLQGLTPETAHADELAEPSACELGGSAPGCLKTRLLSLFDAERTTVWFEQRTGIGRYRWGNIRSGKARLTDAEIEAVAELFPQYALWLVSGQTAPEIGQLSPAPEAAADE